MSHSLVLYLLYAIALSAVDLIIFFILFIEIFHHKLCWGSQFHIQIILYNLNLVAFLRDNNLLFKGEIS
jgi:hypothetical protein